MCVPAGRPEETLRGSFLPAACRAGGCAGSPGSLCRCPAPETEPSGSLLEPEPPSCDSTAAGAPTHSSNVFNVQELRQTDTVLYSHTC